MALPQVGSDGSASGWWPYVAQIGAGIMAGISGAYFMMSGHGNRLSVLENNADNDRKNVKKIEDAVSALAESHRVAYEKGQTQYWELRGKIGELVTSSQFQKSHDDLLSALRELR